MKPPFWGICSNTFWGYLTTSYYCRPDSKGKYTPRDPLLRRRGSSRSAASILSTQASRLFQLSQYTNIYIGSGDNLSTADRLRRVLQRLDDIQEELEERLEAAKRGEELPEVSEEEGEGRIRVEEEEEFEGFGNIGDIDKDSDSEGKDKSNRDKKTRE